MLCLQIKSRVKSKASAGRRTNSYHRRFCGRSLECRYELMFIGEFDTQQKVSKKQLVFVSFTMLGFNGEERNPYSQILLGPRMSKAQTKEPT